MVEADPEVHGELQLALQPLQHGYQHENEQKTNNIRLIHEMRMIMRAIGARMVEENAFDEIEDQFSVTEEEYASLFKEPTSMLNIIRSRR